VPGLNDLREQLLEAPLQEVSYAFAGADGHPWTVLHCSIREAISELYEGVFVLAGHVDHAPDELLGAPARATLQRQHLTRSLHGIVWRVEDLGTTAMHRFVRVTVVPRLRALGQRLDSRIFQEKTVAEIVRDVLAHARVYQGERALTVPPLPRLPKREYCVQYRETDLDFVMRLLQEEGIPFYFKHDGEGSETLVLVDEPPGWTPVSTLHGLPQVVVSDARLHMLSSESIAWFDLQREVTGTGVTLRDYDFTRPRATLDMTPSNPATDQGVRPAYDYPARMTLHSYDEQHEAYTRHDGVAQARLRHELAQVPGVHGRGRGNVTGFVPGTTFELTGHGRQELNRGFLVVKAEHRGQAWSDIPEDVRASEHLLRELREAGVESADLFNGTERYTNRFEVVPGEVPFRPTRVTPRPLVHGSQTARVVGPVGEEIHTDPHGRIKVQFHWDREGRENEHSSCWVRVQQNWAGAGWGFQFIPRIGMEVVVTFLEGDPDRPLVTGCVYNGENHVPYGLPGHKTQSGVKTNSSHTNGGYNEIRFEDRAGEEQLYVQAQRNMDTLVKRDQTLHVAHNRTKLVEGNERNTINLDKSTKILGNEAREVFGNATSYIHGHQGSTTHADNNYNVYADESITLGCGESRVVLNRDLITISSSTVVIHGRSIVRINGDDRVELNCDPPNGGEP
jgi:type VI secretion system secreted protein VgrG